MGNGCIGRHNPGVVVSFTGDLYLQAVGVIHVDRLHKIVIHRTQTGLARRVDAGLPGKHGLMTFRL